MKQLYATKHELIFENDAAGKFAIHHAACVSVDMVNELIQAGANAEQQTIDDQGNTPMHFAALYNKLDIIEYLHNINGELISRANKKGTLPEHIAAENGYIAIVKFVMANKTFNNNDEKEKWLHVLLMLAVVNDRRDIVEYLHSINQTMIMTLRYNGLYATPLHI